MDTALYPLVTRYLVLYDFSMLARYHPDAWRKLLDLDTNQKVIGLGRLVVEESEGRDQLAWRGTHHLAPPAQLGQAPLHYRHHSYLSSSSSSALVGDDLCGLAVPSSVWLVAGRLGVLGLVTVPAASEGVTQWVSWEL